MTYIIEIKIDVSEGIALRTRVPESPLLGPDATPAQVEQAAWRGASSSVRACFARGNFATVTSKLVSITPNP